MHRVAISSGLEWGTGTLQWGTCEVQNFLKWGTLLGYMFPFEKSKVHRCKHHLDIVCINKRLVIDFSSAENS